MRINHNLAALNTYSRLNQATNSQSKSLEKLSAGLRINKAGDDAAGLAISEKMRGQIRGLDQAARNAQDGISMIQTAEGALNETHSILQRMRELAVQSANDTNETVDRGSIQEEMDQLAIELDRIGDTTQFNGKTLLDGTLPAISFQIGANANQNMEVQFSNMKASGVGSLGIGTPSTTSANVDEIAYVSGNTDEIGSVDLTGYTQSLDLDIKMQVTAEGAPGTAAVAEITINGVTRSITADANGAATPTFTLASADFGSIFEAGQQVVINGDNTPTVGDDINISITGKTNTVTGPDVETDAAAAATAITTLNNAIKSVSSERGKLGAIQNRLEHTINNLSTSSENLTASESRIRDVDMAKEMMEFTKNNILSQAATSMLAQANQQPQGVLQLLR